MLRRIYVVVAVSVLFLGCAAHSGNDFTPQDSSVRGDIATTSDGSHPIPDASAGPCLSGSIVCNGNTAQTCDGNGGFTNTMACGTQRCVAGVGCRVCAPNQRFCDSNGNPALCNADGDGSSSLPACASAGQCTAGYCSSLCADAAQGHSYIGCDYWPVSLLNSELGSSLSQGAPPQGVDGFPFAVAIANPQSMPANVMVTGGSLTTPVSQTIAAGALQIVQLPWVQSVSQVVQSNATSQPGGTSVLARGGAYHLTSDVPVTVYQFNALSYQDVTRPRCNPRRNQDCYSYTNDSSLLLPTTVLTENYTAMSMPTTAITDGHSYASQGGFVTIVATAPNTHVTVQLTGGVRAGMGVAATPAHGMITQTLQAGDVLELVSADVTTAADCNHEATPFQTQLGGALYYCQPNPIADLTGSVIHSDSPVAVFGGHDCSNVPFNRGACDHLEQELFPNETLGTHYFISRTQPQLPGGEPNVIRVMSNHDANTITFTPASVHAAVTLNRGEYVQFEQHDDVDVSGTSPFVAAQLLVGEDYFQTGTLDPNAVGDPSLALEVPVEQWRSSYEFLAPDTYTVSFVNVVAPHGATITLDGAALSATATPVGSYDVYRVDISTHTGAHHIESAGAMPFSIKVYGFGSFTSYMYPGGLDLTQIAAPG